MDEPKVGDKASCSMCGAEIEYVGPYWCHIGENQPRHPAVPKQEGQGWGHEPLDWTAALDDRTRKHIAYARVYASDYAHGAPGHLDLMTIAALAKLLDEAQERPVKVQKLTRDEAANCWRDIVTGVQVDVP